ncbi:MAG: acyl-CoA dehydrogenase family protein [Gammaproteobacteria bacterium]|nr:acyl-CoA dehydrogenase family protein [Gammaproteobacteria bacterium]MCY4339998.1 acyl-CoA dehydrogenase family protein [Gammaproteobacteria bacterium]
MPGSHLHWPFFEARHRAREQALDQWCAQQSWEHGQSGAALDASCKAFALRLGEAGFLKIAVPEPYGEDAGLDARSLCLMRETLARHEPLADFVYAMQVLGSAPISLFGTPAQKEALLGGVARGRKLAAFALSEKEAGSDVAAMAMRAEPDGDSYVLNGAKAWISNAGVADFYVVFARTGEGKRGVSAFIVAAETPGFEVSERTPVIAAHPLGSLRFRDCRVPPDAMLGEPGDGLKIALGTLDLCRSTVGAAALGMASRAYAETLKRARNRQLFGGVLGDLQLTQAAVADMATAVDASALLVYRAAWLRDSGQERVTREASMAKLFATEQAQKVIDRAVQLFGGEGVRAGSVVERLYREIRALRIYEGASEIQQLLIARHDLRREGAEKGGAKAP